MRQVRSQKSKFSKTTKFGIKSPKRIESCPIRESKLPEKDLISLDLLQTTSKPPKIKIQQIPKLTILGCSLIIWDLLSDKKIKLHSHSTSILQLCFLSHDDRLICSISGGLTPAMFVTEWESLRRIQQFKFPYKQRSSALESIRMQYSYQNNILGVVENEAGGGYRLSFWEIKNNSVNLLFLNEVEHTGTCAEILFFETIKGSLNFAIVERTGIKYWKFMENNKAVLTNKIFLRTEIVSASISRLTNLLAFVDVLGKAVLINQTGDLVTQINHPEESFSSIYLDDIYAYIGCQSGR